MGDNLNPPQEDLRSQSHGRGGAGNINKRAPNTGANPEDFKTPLIKNDLYTTGRGGTGNMALNLKEVPEMARAAQDVDAPAAHSKEAKGTFHWGRGGQGNMTTVGMTREEEKASHQERGRQERLARNNDRGGSGSRSVIEKGKEMLGFGGKKKGEVESRNGVSEKGKGPVEKNGENAMQD